MTGRHTVALGVAALLLTCVGAQADSNRSGGTVYQTLATPPAAASLAATLPETVTPTSRGKRKHLSRLARQLATKVATGPIEETPSPTPQRSDPAVSPPTGTTPAKDGPHEGPAPTLHDLINKHAQANGVPVNLASAVIQIESRFNPKARGGAALGLMQIQYATARSAGFSGPAIALFQPDINLQFGMKVLGDAYKASHGDLCMTLARYQSGHLTTRMSSANRVYCSKARSFMAKS